MALLLVGVGILVQLLKIPHTWLMLNNGELNGLQFLGQTVELALVIWLCFLIARGRNWARMVFLILTLLDLAAVTWGLRVLFGRSYGVFGMDFMTSTLVTMVLPTLLNIVACLLLFGRAARGWFAAPRE